MDKKTKKVMYVTPMIFASPSLFASGEESWTWSQFAGNAIGGALAGAVGGAAYYSLTVAFG